MTRAKPANGTEGIFATQNARRQKDFDDAEAGLRLLLTDLAAGTFRAHPKAELYPLLEGAERKELFDSIDRKVDMPIYYDRQGRIVDGRNRMDVLLEKHRIHYVPVARIDRHILYTVNEADPANPYSLRVEFRYASEPDIDALIIKLNETRRHLTPDQKIAIAAKRVGAAARGEGAKRMKEPFSETGKGSGKVDTAAIIAADAKGSVSKARIAAKLLDHPEELDAVEAGRKTLKEAEAAVAPVKRRRRTKDEIEVAKEAELDDRIAREVKPGQRMARPLEDTPVPAFSPSEPAPAQVEQEPEKDVVLEIRKAFLTLPLSKRIPCLKELFMTLSKTSKEAFASIALDETDNRKEQTDE